MPSGRSVDGQLRAWRWWLAECSAGDPQVAPVHRGAVVASYLHHRHGHHTRCPGLPDLLHILSPGRQGQHGGPAPVPRWRGPDLRCSPLAAAGAGPAAGPQSAADLGFSRRGASALSAQLRARGLAGLGRCPHHCCRWCLGLTATPAKKTEGGAYSCPRSKRPGRPSHERQGAGPGRYPWHGPHQGPAPSRCHRPMSQRRTRRSGWDLRVSSLP